MENTRNIASVVWFLDSIENGDAAAHVMSVLRGMQYAMRSQSFALLFGKCPPPACSLLAPLVPQIRT